ncbi:hypothetical protein BS17DRAFT_780991 [Gyrodon lividus]|nr:hypothetical protein BS17DRAFT_780991 [Gyrodon lividus]
MLETLEFEREILLGTEELYECCGKPRATESPLYVFLGGRVLSTRMQESRWKVRLSMTCASCGSVVTNFLWLLAIELVVCECSKWAALQV